jgi:hypothetical protein
VDGGHLQLGFIVKVLLVSSYDASVAGNDLLGVVDVLLRVGVDEVVVDGDFVLLEVGDGALVELEHYDLEVEVEALNLLLSLRDGVSEVGDLVNFGVLGEQHGLDGVLAVVQLLQVFLVGLLLAQSLLLLALQFRLPVDGFQQGNDVQHLPLHPQLHNLERVLDFVGLGQELMAS